jgi:hypothetical protein
MEWSNKILILLFLNYFKDEGPDRERLNCVPRVRKQPHSKPGPGTPSHHLPNHLPCSAHWSPFRECRLLSSHSVLCPPALPQPGSTGDITALCRRPWHKMKSGGPHSSCSTSPNPSEHISCAQSQLINYLLQLRRARCS